MWKKKEPAQKLFKYPELEKLVDLGDSSLMFL